MIGPSVRSLTPEKRREGETQEDFTILELPVRTSAKAVAGEEMHASSRTECLSVGYILLVIVLSPAKMAEIVEDESAFSLTHRSSCDYSQLLHRLQTLLPEPAA